MHFKCSRCENAYIIDASINSTIKICIGLSFHIYFYFKKLMSKNLYIVHTDVRFGIEAFNLVSIQIGCI
jgi:hypothetical protein